MNARRIQLLDKLPQNVKEIVLSVYASNVNKEIYDDFDVSGFEASELTTLQTDIILKSSPIENLAKEIAARFDFEEADAKDFAMEIAGKRLLILDDWLGGAVSKYIKTLGGNPSDFKPFVDEYKKQVAKENTPEPEEIVAPNVEVAIDEEEVGAMFGLNMEPTTPDADKRDIKNIFQNEIVALLRGGAWQKKASVNVLTIYYLGAEPAFRDELIRVMMNSAEKIGGQTIGAWLKSFVAKVEENGRLNPIKEAQFFTSDMGVLGLETEEREIVERLFDLYANLRNFVEDISKKPLEDVVIFPFTAAEREQIDKDVAAFERTKPPAFAEASAGKPKFSLNDEKNRAAISAEYDARTVEFKGDKNKILKYFDSAKANRDSVKLLVGLQLLVENKFLVTDALEPKELIGSLRETLETGAGLSQSEAASFGAWLASNLGKQGLFKYAQMAYFDEAAGIYKWNL
jgi:hypothetical protein